MADLPELVGALCLDLYALAEGECGAHEAWIACDAKQFGAALVRQINHPAILS